MVTVSVLSNIDQYMGRISSVKMSSFQNYGHLEIFIHENVLIPFDFPHISNSLKNVLVQTLTTVKPNYILLSLSMLA